MDILIPRRHFLSIRGSSIAIVAVLVFAMPAVCTAQAQKPELSPGAIATDKPPAAEFAPRGERMTREITYSAWRKLCFKLPDAKVLCRTTISGTFDTGQVAIRVDLIEREGEGAARLQIFLPVGLYLQAGVKLTVDQGKPVLIPYVWCLTNTCIAGNLADPDFIHEMEAGQKLALEVVDSSILTITSTMPLDQFATIRRGPPSQIFERDSDDE